VKAFDPQSPAALRTVAPFTGPGPDWSLAQGSSQVGLIEVTDEGTWLAVPGERWSVRAGRGGAGSVIEFAPTEAAGSIITYRPNLRAGGRFDYAGQRRYRLAVSPFRGFWTLRGEQRVELAKLRYVAHPGKGEAGMDVEPCPAAATEPRLLVLLLASCFVLVTEPRR
jgi:hypothetical protein